MVNQLAMNLGQAVFQNPDSLQNLICYTPRLITRALWAGVKIYVKACQLAKR